jgi:transcriptional regulator with XRE-family HTH domain
MSLLQQRQKWAKQVRALREKRGFSQDHVARCSKYSLSYVTKIENAKEGTVESVAYLVRLIKTLPSAEEQKSA